MKLTLEIPDEMGQTLQPLEAELPQILHLGLQQFYAKPSQGLTGLTEILEFLAKLPSPQEILDLHLSPTLQAEIEQLLSKNRREGLNTEEQKLWQHYEFVEHLVRLAKTQALLKLQCSNE